MKKINKIAIITALLLVIMSIMVVEAYTYTGYKWANVPSGSPLIVKYKWGTNITNNSMPPYTTCKTQWTNAVSNWNSCQYRISFSYSSSATSILDTYFLSSSSEYGICTTSYDSNNMTTKFTAQLNTGNSNLTSNATVAQSTGSHELGHAMGLGHGTLTAVMNTSRDRTVIYKPQTDDKNGINALYP